MSERRRRHVLTQYPGACGDTDFTAVVVWFGRARHFEDGAETAQKIVDAALDLAGRTGAPAHVRLAQFLGTGVWRAVLTMREVDQDRANEVASRDALRKLESDAWDDWLVERATEGRSE